MEDIEILDIESGQYITISVPEKVAQYIEALEQTNRILKFQSDTVSQTFLDQQDEVDAMLDFTHESHMN